MAAGIVVARTLGPERRGYMGLVVLAANTLFAFSHLGLGASITYYTGKKLLPENKILGFIVLMSILLGVSIGGIFLLVYPYIEGVWTDIPRPVMIIGLTSLPFIFLYNFLKRYLLGILRVTQSNIITFVQNFSYVILVFIFLYFMRGGVKAGVTCFALSFTFASLLGFVLFTKHARPLGTIPPSKTGPFFNYGLKFFLSILFRTTAYRIGAFIIKYYLSASDVSFYLMAVNIGERMWLIPTALTHVLLPTLLSMNRKSVQFSAKVCRNNFFVMILISLLLTIFGKSLIVLMYGEQYAPAAKALYSILWGVAVWPIYSVLAIDFASRKQLGVNIAASFTGAVINIGGTFYLVPRYGFVGAGIATSVSYTVMALVTLVWFMRLGETSLREVLIPTADDFRSYRDAFFKGLRKIKRVFAKTG